MTATLTATLITMEYNTMECEFECEWECAYCELMDEYCKEGINWEIVCRLLQDNPALCSKRDDWDWYPLHFACYHNAPISVIEILINIWPEGLNETVKFINESTGYSYDNTPLEWACGASAPDKVITLLVQTSCKLSYQINDEAGAILMDMNQDLHLLKKLYDHWEWYHQKEHLFCPQKERSLYHK